MGIFCVKFCSLYIVFRLLNLIIDLVIIKNCYIIVDIVVIEVDMCIIKGVGGWVNCLIKLIIGIS